METTFPLFKISVHIYFFDMDIILLLFFFKFANETKYEEKNVQIEFN